MFVNRRGKHSASTDAKRSNWDGKNAKKNELVLDAWAHLYINSSKMNIIIRAIKTKEDKNEKVPIDTIGRTDANDVNSTNDVSILSQVAESFHVNIETNFDDVPETFTFVVDLEEAS